METAVNLFVGTMARIGMIFSIAAIGLGVVYISRQEWVQVRKERAAHFDEHYEQRKDIRDFGVKLITIGALIGSLTYAGLTFQRSEREFSAKIRPFLSGVLLRTDKTSFYQIIEHDQNLFLRLQLRIKNVGTVPAYDPKITWSYELEGQKVGREKEERKHVLFPGDEHVMSMHVELNRSKFRDTDFVRKYLEQHGPLKVYVRLDYTGPGRTRKLYYTSYQLMFDSPNSHVVVDGQADRTL